jgi:hypothetical protein
MASTRKSFPLPTEYKLERDVVINAARVVNMYVIPADSTVQGVAWVPCSGFQSPFMVGSGNIRAQFIFKDTMYAVSGDAFYRIDTGLVPTFINNLTTLSGYVKITANEVQLIIVDGANAYIYNTSTAVFSTVAFPFPVVPTDVTVLDNYFVLINSGSQKFYVSNLNDGTTWQTLNFALFESNPDQLFAINCLKRRVYLFGHYSTEVWYDAGATDFPLRRDNNSLFEHGCASPGTVQEGFEIMMYLAQNQDGAAGVMLVQGTAYPQKVSSPELDLYLQNVVSLSSSQAILYKENGFTFYQLSFSTDNKTFLYVVETNKWSEIEMPDGDRSPISTHAFFNNKHYVGMADENKIYQLSYQFFTYRNELIRCQLISPPFYSDNNERIRMDRFQLEAVTGIPQGTLPNQMIYPQLNDLVAFNIQPTVLLFISRDGGVTYGNGRRATMGRLGQYIKRVLWTRLGCQRARRLVLRIEFPFLVPFIVIGAYIIYEVLPE